MKLKRIYIILQFLIPLWLFGQEPPPYFKLYYADFKTDSANYRQVYDFVAFSFYDSLQWESSDREIDWAKRGFIFYEKKEYFQMWIPKERVWPRKMDIVRLSVRKKNTGDVMHVFIRFDHELGYGEEVYFDGLTFQTGNYFFDFKESKKRYEAILPKCYGSKILVGKLSKRKIKVTQLEKILKKKSNISLN